MANPTDNLPAFAVAGLPSTTAPIPQVQPNLPKLVPQQPATVVPPAAPAVNAFVPRGPTPYGVPGAAAVPVTANATPAAAPVATTPVAAAAPTNADPTLAARIADVPDGGRLVTMPAAGTPAAATAAPAVGGNATAAGLVNPQAAISAGYDRQQAYGQNFLDQALSYIGGGGDIFERATRGRAIAGILHAVAGQNNEGSAQASGANGFNSALAGITDANTMAGASMYNADVGQQNVESTNASRVALGRMDLEGGTADIGQTQSFDPSTGMYSTVTNKARRVVGPGGAVALQPITPPTRQAAAPKPVVGAQYQDAKGNIAIYQQDGTYKAMPKAGN